MADLYGDTSLTPMRVARSSGYIDWASQPALFKHYPEFLYRYPFGSDSALKQAELSRFISRRSIVGGKPYYQLNTPAAGNLHPIELYVQIRGIKGVLSGIYHVDAQQEALVLIREIERDGLEAALGLQNRFNGMLYLVSCVPFRSEWKYGDRAFRYCYMDAGHQVGAVCAAAALEGQNATILSDFDVDALNRSMGFGTEEFTCAVLAVGEESERPVEPLKSALMQVAPTDYCENRGALPAQIAAQKTFYSSCKPDLRKVDETAIGTRHSARHFEPQPMAGSQFEYFMHRVTNAPAPLRSFVIVLQSDGVEQGVYSEGRLRKAGDFAETSAALLVDQRFVKDAAMIVVMTAENFGPGELMCAGVFAQSLYLETAAEQLGFTGIGAFYDRKLQQFLETQDPVIYVGALGVERIRSR